MAIHRKEVLAKSGYKQDIKYKYFNHPFLYLWLHNENRIKRFDDLYYRVTGAASVHVCRIIN
jgi:hypothetical protein